MRVFFHCTKSIRSFKFKYHRHLSKVANSVYIAHVLYMMNSVQIFYLTTVCQSTSTVLYHDNTNSFQTYLVLINISKQFHSNTNSFVKCYYSFCGNLGPYHGDAY